MFVPDWRLLLFAASSSNIATVSIQEFFLLLEPVRLAHLLLLFFPLFLHADDVQHVAQVDEGWRGHEDDLQHPEADVRDGEGLVIADVLTSGLLGVTREVGLLVTPDLFGRSPQHQDPEDEEDSQPDFADDR